jgi:diaminopropionate ammonia-lyase
MTLEPTRVRLVVNAQAATRDTPYGSRRAATLSPAGFDDARREIAAWPGYRPTPLVALPGLAEALGLGAISYKDEGGRFGLGSFKALGGAYATLRAIQRALTLAGIEAHVSIDHLVARRYADAVSKITVTSATDGNHGRSVAWGAKLFGCRAVIVIHATVSENRRTAIAAYGADVVRVSGGYDDSVRHAFKLAAENGWHVVQDTAQGAYRETPADITYGYGVIGAEIVEQMPTSPSHVLVQAGVGGLASAIAAQFWLRWGARRPKFIVLEPVQADCVFQSLEAGRQTIVTGDLETVMAGLSCGEVSDTAWDILAEGANAALAISDDFALAGMRRLASPTAGDPPIVGGECSGGAIGALLALTERPDVRRQLGIDASSHVLLIGTEGDTDPDIYCRTVGRTADEVRQGVL